MLPHSQKSVHEATTKSLFDYMSSKYDANEEVKKRMESLDEALKAETHKRRVAEETVSFSLELWMHAQI